MKWNEMAPQTIAPGCQNVCRKTVRLVSHRFPGRLQIRIRWSSRFSSKRNSSLKTILLQSVSFQCEWARHHWRRACCTEVNGCRHKGRCDLSPLSVSRLWMVLAVTEALLARTIDNNEESGAVSAALTIAHASRSVVSLGLSFPFWRCERPWFTHSYQHCLKMAWLLLKCRSTSAKGHNLISRIQRGSIKN